jgi:hypothetical protein
MVGLVRLDSVRVVEGIAATFVVPDGLFEEAVVPCELLVWVAELLFELVLSHATENTIKTARLKTLCVLKVRLRVFVYFMFFLLRG